MANFKIQTAPPVPPSDAHGLC